MSRKNPQSNQDNHAEKCPQCGEPTLATVFDELWRWFVLLTFGVITCWGWIQYDDALHVWKLIWDWIKDFWNG